ncbi:hypothetical protein FDECE_16229 [Fusarium decemcellulare]|nr:hypothetical protein FDECE_16229 [Fusarium decemcellulare]
MASAISSSSAMDFAQSFARNRIGRRQLHFHPEPHLSGIRAHADRADSTIEPHLLILPRIFLSCTLTDHLHSDLFLFLLFTASSSDRTQLVSSIVIAIAASSRGFYHTFSYPDMCCGLIHEPSPQTSPPSIHNHFLFRSQGNRAPIETAPNPIHLCGDSPYSSILLSLSPLFRLQ